MERRVKFVVLLTAAFLGSGCSYCGGSSGAGAGDAAAMTDAGEEIFFTRCWMCHDPESEEPGVGPGLKNLYQRPPHTLTDGWEHLHTDADMRRVVEQGNINMPPMGETLSAGEIDQVLAYLRTL